MLSRIIIQIALLILLTGCTSLPPVTIENGEVIHYCNDPKRNIEEPCITDDRALFVGVLLGSVVFISSSTLIVVRFVTMKQNKRA